MGSGAAWRGRLHGMQNIQMGSIPIGSRSADRQRNVVADFQHNLKHIGIWCNGSTKDFLIQIFPRLHSGSALRHN